MSANYIITISREYGSGGKEIGKVLADELGLPYYDSNIITMAAEKSGTPEDVFIENEEKGASRSLLYSLSALKDTISGNFPLSDRLFMAQSQVIREVAEKGACVIVGRCADYVLRDRDNVINIFIHAPFAERVKRACCEYGVDADKAAAEVVRVDKRRAAYNDYYSFLKWGQGNHYDLCINSAIGVENTVSLIKQYIKMREAG